MGFDGRAASPARCKERDIVRNIYKRGAVVGAVSGALMLAAAQSALAAPTQSPEGIGLYASGLMSVSNTPDATSANPNPGSVATVGAGILTANAVTAQVNGNTTTAGTAGLSALGLGPAISAGAISSSCTANSDGTFTRTSNVANLVIAGSPIATANAAPNTTVNVPLVGTVIVNQQVAGPTPGSVTVNALVINGSLLNQNVTIASSTCGPYAAPAPVAGGKGLVVGLGALGAGAVGVAAVRLNRRRRLAGA
jgi:hypothetical protein